MARAGRVPGIHPKRPMVENAARVIAYRLDEFLSWRGALTNPAEVQELHDMRIAAKRLRYALEIFEPCFPGMKPMLKALIEIQEELGTIHDLDVLADMLRGRLRILEAPLEEEATLIMASDLAPVEKNIGIRRLLSRHGRDQQRVGLYGLIGDKVAERRERYYRFSATWSGEKLEDFAAQLHEVIVHEPSPALSSDRPGQQSVAPQKESQAAGSE